MESNSKLYLGIDVGSVTVKVVLLSEKEELLKDYYVRSHGAPLSTVIDILDDLFKDVSPARVAGLGTAGSGGELFSTILGGVHMNELIAQTEAINRFHPEARTVIEMGGQDSKLLILEQQGQETVLTDFSLNTQCAAGTGSFLDQQAARLGMSIEEFSLLALKSENPPPIAGRCAVFAKSDIIHLQQVGTPTHDIVAGLCYALARNYRSDIGQGKKFRKPILFQGGVSRNVGMVRAFTDVLGLERGELVIPQHDVLMAAIGTALIAKAEAGEIEFSWEENRRKLTRYARQREAGKGNHKRLRLKEGPPLIMEGRSIDGDGQVEAYLGIDVGSISTNLVAIDREGRMVGRVYLRTAGDPLRAVQEGLRILNEDTKGKLKVVGAGTTGSGRELIGRFVSADIVKNEITSQAVAAVAIDPEVDTVFEIGGQDSKFIRLDKGAVVDFAMNKVCAAGTGSFLEEQAERLGIGIEDFGRIALECEEPVGLGERCTVFMESDLIHHQQRGAKKEELVAGLAYSIAYNYLNRVVGNHKIGDQVLFQGGVAWNKAVLAAFQELTGKEVRVPPHHDVTGAYGVALIVKEQMESPLNGSRTKFRGFTPDRNYEVSHFTCRGCSNLCEIKVVKFADSPPLFYGARCGKFDELKKETKGKGIPNLFAKREELLWNPHREELDIGDLIRYRPYGKKQGRIGIPRVLLFWDKFPFWREFFRSLGYEVLLSPTTNQGIIRESIQGATALACLPSKVVHGHVNSLLKENLDYLFLPAMINSDFGELRTKVNQNCPLIQGMPYIANGQFDFKNMGLDTEVISEPFHFYRPQKLLGELKSLGKRLGGTRREPAQAIERGGEEQRSFEAECHRRGQEALKLVSSSRKGIVVLARSYNGCDRGLNLNIPEKLQGMGAIVIPLDFLPLEEVDWQNHAFMHWHYGKKILAAAEIVRKTPNLYGVQLSHFMCGPDSFISHYVRETLLNEPLLQLEIDEHSADAGIITRCEAFLDSLSSKALLRGAPKPLKGGVPVGHH